MNQSNQSQKMVKLAYDALEDKKGKNIEIIDIQGISVIADYFMIADGDSVNQVQAMADNVQEELGKAGFVCNAVEGYQTANWILLDYGDVIIHVFQKTGTEFETSLTLYGYWYILKPSQNTHWGFRMGGLYGYTV